MDITAIRNGLASAVEGVSGIEQSFPRMPDEINPSTFVVAEYDLSRHLTFGSTGGLKLVPFNCLLLTSRGDTDTGRKALDDFLSDGANSVFAAIEADLTLDGACKQLVADGASGVGRLYEIAGVSYLGAEITVRVWAT